MKLLRKFLDLEHRDKASVVKTLPVVLAVRSGLYLFPERVVSKWLAKERETSTTHVAPNWELVDDIVKTVRRCCSYIPHATCLTQALSVLILLRRSGHLSEMKIGVRKDREGKFHAHAWVEVEGKIVIGDLPHLDGFNVLRSSSVIV
jgi:hypothetical protein